MRLDSLLHLHDSTTRRVVLLPWRRLGRASRVAGCLALVNAVAPTASAVTQPDGAPIPALRGTECRDGSVQGCLNQHEGTPGLVDAMTHARTAPETFDPRCDLTFSVLARGAVTAYSFGWYNVVVDTARPGVAIRPAPADLHFFLECNDPIGMTRSLNIRDDPRYKGGEIAFFLAAGPCPRPPGTVSGVKYSQSALNDTNGSKYIHVLNWQSVAHEDGFYFGWEGLPQGGDNDFDDLMTFVSGIQCSGGGAPCDAGGLGICAQGVMLCQRGELTCVATQLPQVETCNAVDDDCNGTVDEGNLCGFGEACSQGRCVPLCSSGEFPCRGSWVCSATGACIDPACVDVRCDVGQACVAGQCIDPCAGVTCPFGQACRLGLCVDRCTGIVCDEGYACDQGVCVTCACSVCDPGLVCRDNRCIEEACTTVTCPPGHHCANGACIDDCEGATCPAGAACVGGQCQSAPPPAGGAPGTDPLTILPDSGTHPIPNTGTGGSSAQTPGRVSPLPPASSSGCGCHTAPPPSPLWLAGLGLLLARAGRRRRGRAPV